MVCGGESDHSRFGCWVSFPLLKARSFSLLMIPPICVCICPRCRFADEENKWNSVVIFDLISQVARGEALDI